MDFDDTPQEAAFRAEAVAFLSANAARKTRATRAYQSLELDAAAVKRAQAWQAKKADAGFAGMTWPRRYGGRGGTPLQQIIYNQEEENYVVPRGVFNQGVGLVIPTMMTYAPPETIERYARPALRGDEIWCQLFSEPSAGSDLAGLRTRAELVGDEWIVNGHKIWNSNAHFADHAILVARSDPTVAKHAGLTFFHLGMKTPGIAVRRIRQISGVSNFTEVFLDNVRIPDSQRLGKVGEGWKVAITTLANERYTIGESEGPDFEDIFAFARGHAPGGVAALESDAVRERLADWYIKRQGLRYIRFRTLTALSRGENPGPESSIGKLISAPKLQEIASYGMDLLGMAGGVMDESAPMNAWFQNALLYAPGKRIAGGTDEIMRNIVAERVLGLPADMRADKDIPFNKIPTGRN
ncbi:MAG TPA: acyl-CoA dehydrogenase family protein [Rhizomicrobium sp.]